MIQTFQKTKFETPSVELVAEYVKVKLKKLCSYVIVSINYTPSGVADSNIQLRQNLFNLSANSFMFIHPIWHNTKSVP